MAVIDTGNINNMPQLDKINYTRLDFDSVKAGIINFIQTNYPTVQNDFFESNAGVMLIDILSYLHDILAFRTDFLANEAYLPTAATTKAIQNLLSLINYAPAGQAPAVGTVQITLTDVDPAIYSGGALNQDIVISISTAPYVINITDTAGNPLSFEVFKSASDTQSSVIFPAGSVIGNTMNATIIEGTTVFQNVQLPSLISKNFNIVLPNTSVMQSSIQVKINGALWRLVTNFAYESGPTATFTVTQTEDGTYQVNFGDGVFGAIPPANGIVEISYRIGGGTLGNINLGVMNVVQSISTASGGGSATFNFTNITATTGGADPEDLNFSKKIAPKNYAAQLRTVTGEDYTVYAIGYKDGTNGSISKALSTLRPYLSAYGKNSGPYNIDTTNNVFQVKIDDVTRTLTLTPGSNLTIGQIVDDFNTQVASLFSDPSTIDFEGFSYSTVAYRILGQAAQPSIGTVTIDTSNNKMAFLFGTGLFTVSLATGDRTYQQIVDDINTQINTGANTGLIEFRADLYTITGSTYIQFVTVSPFNLGSTTFQIAAATDNAYALLGLSTAQTSTAYNAFSFACGLTYHMPSAALEIMNVANSCYSVLGLDFSTGTNGLGRAFPMAANYVDIYVLANGSNNTLTFASDSLKSALTNFINRFRVMTDKITILDGLLKYIGMNITVYVNKSYDITAVGNFVQQLMNTYMSGLLNNFGDPLYVSKVYEIISAVDGVDHSTITNITENGVSQLTTGSKQIRDVSTKFNEVWTNGGVTLTMVYA